MVMDTAGRYLAGARVEVVDGPQAGTSTTSGAGGEFWLMGTFDDATRFRASREGHGAQTRTLSPLCAVCNPANRYVYFNLDVLAPPVNIAGNYTLTFAADPACAALPDQARTRRYAVSVAPSADRPNTLFDVKFIDAPFLENYSWFSIGVAGDYLAFWLGDAHGSPGLVEQIAPNTYLAFEGGATGIAAPDGSTLSMSLEGFIEYCEMTSDVGARYSCGPAQTVAHCVSKNHRVSLTRR